MLLTTRRQPPNGSMLGSPAGSTAPGLPRFSRYPQTPDTPASIEEGPNAPRSPSPRGGVRPFQRDLGTVDQRQDPSRPIFSRYNSTVPTRTIRPTFSRYPTTQAIGPKSSIVTTGNRGAYQLDLAINIYRPDQGLPIQSNGFLLSISFLRITAPAKPQTEPGKWSNGTIVNGPESPVKCCPWCPCCPADKIPSALTLSFSATFWTDPAQRPMGCETCGPQTVGMTMTLALDVASYIASGGQQMSWSQDPGTTPDPPGPDLAGQCSGTTLACASCLCGDPPPSYRLCFLATLTCDRTSGDKCSGFLLLITASDNCRLYSPMGLSGIRLQRISCCPFKLILPSQSVNPGGGSYIACTLDSVLVT